MKKLTLIFCIFAFACTKEQPKLNYCFDMILSNALPIQFWINGQQTFNEDVVGFPIIHKCFTQEFKCDDNIKIQIQDTSGQKYFLSLIDKDSVVAVVLPLTEVNQNQIIVNGIFSNDFTNFSEFQQSGYNDPLKTNSWSFESTDNGRLKALVEQTGPNINNTLIIKKGCSGISGDNIITAKWGINNSAVSSNNYKLQLYLIKAGIIFQTVTVDTKAGTTSSFSNTITDLAFTANSSYDEIGMGVTFTSVNNSETVYIYNFQSQSVQLSTYELNFVPQDNNACEKKLQLFLTTGTGLIPTVYATPINTWVNHDIGNEDWDISTDASVTLDAFSSSNQLGIPVNGIVAGQSIDVDLKVTTTATSACQFTGRFRKSGVNCSEAHLYDASQLSNIDTKTFLLTDDPDEFYLVALVSASASAPLTYVVDHALKVYVPPAVVQAKSDFINFSQTIATNTLIRYKSNTNFAGLIYPGDNNYYSIRVPGAFYHYDFPIQVKSIELSNSQDINTGSVQLRQKTLSINDCPYFFHDKLILALQHAVSGSVVINNVEWGFDNGYTIDKSSDPMYSFRRASADLVRRNSVTRNVL